MNPRNRFETILLVLLSVFMLTQNAEFASAKGSAGSEFILPAQGVSHNSLRVDTIHDKKEIRRSAKNGWCCNRGRINRTTQQQCKQKKGTFYLSNNAAKKKCIAPVSFTQPSTPRNLKNRELANGMKTSPGLHKISTAKRIQLVKKPDLIPTRIWVNKTNCRLWVEWKNNGGAAPSKTFTERITLDGTFRHGTTIMQHHSFDSRSKFPIPANYLLNNEVIDLYEIVILGSTNVRFTIDGTNVHSESNEWNNTMITHVNCMQKLKKTITPGLAERIQLPGNPTPAGRNTVTKKTK